MAGSPYLECGCGKGLFIKAIKLRQSQAGGVVEEVAGWHCFECGSKVETMKLLQLREMREKKQELDRLTKEIADEANARAEKSGGKETGVGDSSSGKDSLPDSGKRSGV